MSELIVKPITIDEIKPHPNADRLEIAVVGGWHIVTGKGNYSVGDVVVHIQPDSMVPRAWAQTWGVEQYLSFKKDSDMGRVRAARLRSVTSFGFLVPNESGAPLDTDLADHYGITKYEPPPPPVGMSAGQMRSEHPLFYRYTDIQNLRNYKDKLCYDEPLVVTEKIHGTNSRVGWVREEEFDADPLGYGFLNELVIGTHRTQRNPDDCGIYGLPMDLYGSELAGVAAWLEVHSTDKVNSVIFFGEIYGAGVQDLHYGAKQEKDYRLFDVSVNGDYLPWRTLEYFQERFGLPLVPVLARGVFDFENLVELAQGKTELDDSHIREGVVVRPWAQELKWGKGELDPNPRRMIFKLISDEYLCRKGGSEYH
jgi:RNA ligase (TIGR02306 family)